MNKILQLFDEEYVLKFFKENILPLYPSFTDIDKIKIKPFKKMVWTTTYHVVIGFDVYFIDNLNKKTKIMIVCSAHSEETRENVFAAMKYLWSHNFNQGDIDIPRPLFYSEYFRGTFYRGIKGENLLYYIKNKDRETVEKLLPLTAQLFARLHALPAGTAANFNPINSRIKTVIPGVDNILKEISTRYNNKFDSVFSDVYKILITKEEEFFQSHLNLQLIHGDAHTENIIKTGDNRVGLIDFTDFCLGDFARDLGTFLQQLEYKIAIKGEDIKWAQAMQDLFLNSYFAATDIKLTPQLNERIRLYYDWTAIRTVVFLFLKHDSDPKRAEILLNKVKEDLKIK